MDYVTRRRITAVEEPCTWQVAQIKSSKAADAFVRQFWHSDIDLYESFFVVIMNQANETIAYAKISQGAVNYTAVDPRIICKLVVDNLASSVILCHNHPSGNLEPSQSDLVITQKVATCLANFDVKVLDHLIITRAAYYSFADNDHGHLLKPKAD